ncbi:MAG: universal stress protein, partial [Pseudonocardia sediminis]
VPADGADPAWLQGLAGSAAEVGATVDVPRASAGEEQGEGADWVAGLLVRRSSGARLVVVGSYGEGARSGMLAGSVALALIERAECPVAVVRGGTPDVRPPDEGPVVVGVDGTASAGTALDFASRLATAFGTRVLAVHTWSDVVSDTAGAAHRLAGDGTTLGGFAGEILRDAVAGARERHPGLEIEGELVEGSPLRAVLDRADGARAVVVGHREHLPPASMSVTSTGRGLVGFASCPVVVVREAPVPD